MISKDKVRYKVSDPDPATGLVTVTASVACYVSGKLPPEIAEDEPTRELLRHHLSDALFMDIKRAARQIELNLRHVKDDSVVAAVVDIKGIKGLVEIIKNETKIQ